MTVALYLIITCSSFSYHHKAINHTSTSIMPRATRSQRDPSGSQAAPKPSQAERARRSRREEPTEEEEEQAQEQMDVDDEDDDDAEGGGDNVSKQISSLL